MRLDEFLESVEVNPLAERRRLAAEKSYGITEYLEDVESRFASTIGSSQAFDSRAPDIFVGRFGYPTVSAGVLSPIGDEDRADTYKTSSAWYREQLAIEDIVKRRAGLLNARDHVDVDVADAWSGTIGTQREVAIADRPVDIAVDMDDTPEFTFDVEGERVAPIGPRVGASSMELGENPHVPKPVEQTLSDDDWNATGAMTYLYRRDFDVYDIRSILSAGALGRTDQRRLVPTRWSITAVDDTVGQYLHGRVTSYPSIDETRVHFNEFLGNRYWIILTPGPWEYELVEMKGPGSVWNPDQGNYWIASAYEGTEGRSQYVEETAGAYYAARLAVLEHLEAANRQAKALVLREVTDDYWAPVGVWQVREGVRNAFQDDERPVGLAETFGDAIDGVLPQLPLDKDRITRNSMLLAGRQGQLSDFTDRSS